MIMRIASFLCCRLTGRSGLNHLGRMWLLPQITESGENDGDSGKEPEICDRVWQITQMLVLRDQRLGCKAILPIDRLPVFEISFEVVWAKDYGTIAAL